MRKNRILFTYHLFIQPADNCIVSRLDVLNNKWGGQIMSCNTINVCFSSTSMRAFGSDILVKMSFEMFWKSS